MEEKKEESFVFEELERRDIKQQKKERWERISGSRYNKWYKRVKGEGIPGYLKKWVEGSWGGGITKYRMGKGVREEIY